MIRVLPRVMGVVVPRMNHYYNESAFLVVFYY